MIGIFGGSFDPIHYGHLLPVAQVAAALGLERVHFVVAARPPHRAPPVASAEQRLAMVRLALADRPRFVADDREFSRAGPSYMADTLDSFRAEYRQQRLCLILGLDAFLGLPTWHEWQRIPLLVHFVVLQRPGWVGQDLPDWASSRASDSAADLEQQAAGRVLFQPITPQSISATEIRAAVRSGQSVAGLLPEAVLGYIRENRLYQS